jgi:hypothetical protein
MAVTTNKDHPEGSAKADAVPAVKQGPSDPQDVIDKETAQGFRGVEVDPTPNENYTLQGVTSGKPTPETDVTAAEAARKARTDTASKAAGVGER